MWGCGAPWGAIIIIVVIVIVIVIIIIVRHVGRCGGRMLQCRHSTSDAIITNHSFVLSSTYCFNWQ